jgi:hypothetical protein
LTEGQSAAEGLDRELVPAEARLRPHSGDRITIGEQELAWRPHRLTDSFIDFNQLVGMRTQYRVAYAVCYLFCDQERTGLRVGIGSDDSSKVYLNGNEIYTHHQPRKLGANLNEVGDITLHPGTHVLVLKVVNNETLDWKGAVRLIDRDGRCVRGVQVRSPPPPAPLPKTPTYPQSLQ